MPELYSILRSAASAVDVLGLDIRLVYLGPLLCRLLSQIIIIGREGLEGWALNTGQTTVCDQLLFGNNITI